MNPNFSLGNIALITLVYRSYEKPLFLACKWTIISNFLQAENSYFIENIV